MPDRPWKGIGTFSETKLTAYQGAGLMRLHRYGDAQRVLLQTLGQLDSVQVKHRCTAHIDLAAAVIILRSTRRLTAWSREAASSTN